MKIKRFAEVINEELMYDEHTGEAWDDNGNRISEEEYYVQENNHYDIDPYGEEDWREEELFKKTGYRKGNVDDRVVDLERRVDALEKSIAHLKHGVGIWGKNIRR